MLATKLKAEIMYKLDYKLEVNLVPGISSVLVNMSNMKSMQELMTV